MAEKQKIKIGFVNYSLDTGGVETLILEICKRMNRDIFEPYIFVFKKDGTFKKEYMDSGVTVREIKKKEAFDWFLPFRLAKALREDHVDIVHTHNSSNWLYGCIAAKFANIPIVHTEHSTRNFNSKHAKRWAYIEKILACFTDAITVVAEATKKQMVEFAKLNPSKIRVIYNGIFYENYSRPADQGKVRNDLLLNYDDIVVGNIARFYEIKDHETLLKAFKIISGKLQNAKLILVGDGPLKEKMEDMAQSLQLTHKVKFLGNRKDILELLRVMDVFILSSKKEALPIVLLEAMASGLPVVATDVGGNPEVVGTEETGLLVPAGNPEALAEALVAILTDKNRARQMGERGRRRIKQHFDFNIMLEQYESIYRSLAFKKKICVAGEFPPPPGGMALQAELLVTNLKKERQVVYPLKRNISFEGVLKNVNEVRILKSVFRFIAYVLNLIITIRKIDVIHIFSNSYYDFFLYTYPAVFAGKIFRKKCIINYRGGAAEEFFKKFYYLVIPVIKMADVVVVPSEFLKNIFEKYGIKANVVPNICDVDKFKFEKRNFFSPNFIISRHLDEKYNIECGMRAFHLIKMRYSDARLKICGDGPEENRLKNLAYELNLTDSIEFLGNIDNFRLPLVYKSSDIFLNPSNVDNMPISVLEAFASGLPIVSTNAGGLRFLIEDRKTGFLVEKNDYEGMAKIVFEIIEQPEMTKEIVSNAKKIADTYSWEKIGSKWHEVYAS